MRKLFGTDGIRGKANVYPLTIDMCSKLAQALAKKFKRPVEKNSAIKPLVIIGKDTRISCDMLEHSLAASFSSLGIDVKLIGTCPTPAVSILTPKFNAVLGIMISASHNHFSDNGIKIFNEFGLKLKDGDEEEIESIMENIDESCENSTDFGRIEYERPLHNGVAIDIYCDQIKKMFRFEKKIKIVVDSSNGSFSEIAPKIFREFGFDLISINDSPNGTNINEDCGVMNPHIISSEVLKNKADLGIAFDGDGDRLLLCDEFGNLMNGDCILAILVESENLKNSEVVSTVMANFGLEQYLKSRQIQLVRTKVGDRYIAEYMQKSKAKFGGEPSGHMIIKEHALTGDGLFASLKILEYLVRSKKKASELCKIFSAYPTVSRNIKVKDKSIISRSVVAEQIWKFEKQLLNRGKLIVRASGTESLIRISAEGENESELKNIVDILSAKIEGLK
jgi:phosphoglucosamine mutase